MSWQGVTLVRQVMRWCRPFPRLADSTFDRHPLISHLKRRCNELRPSQSHQSRKCVFFEWQQSFCYQSRLRGTFCGCFKIALDISAMTASWLFCMFSLWLRRAIGDSPWIYDLIAIGFWFWSKGCDHAETSSSHLIALWDDLNCHPFLVWCLSKNMISITFIWRTLEQNCSRCSA
jgi:hypothetical protein